MKRPLMGGLIAKIKGQVGVVVAAAIFVEAHPLQIHSALGKPIVLGHSIDE